ncbi:MAG: 4Fe-4S dicluster domain-containing protein [Candidatus Marinimicrobia bacterium]|nr:4Fe-4S dicluster domain-containing protein [Candidatus Neomarinimicrobiota bacterium]
MLTIEKKEIEKLAKELSKKHSVISPTIKTNGETVFEKVSSNNKLDFEYTTTVLSIKEFFFPAKEALFVFDKKKNKITRPKKEEDILVFGLNLRDTEALVHLDEIMAKPNKDNFYFQKRDNATVVSLINEKGHIPHIGIDLILEKINSSQYKAIVLTKKGKKITQNKHFKECQINQIKTEDKENKNSKLKELLSDPEFLKDAVKWSWKNYPEIWEELGKQCLGCGICTYVCPLCHCFSNKESCGITGEKCTKSREWTACTLVEFSKITGGHNFHPTMKERYYNWFYHKFVRAYNEYGKSQCVACGRCKKYCPAGINIEEVLLEIINKYKPNTKN